MAERYRVSPEPQRNRRIRAAEGIRSEKPSLQETRHPKEPWPPPRRPAYDPKVPLPVRPIQRKTYMSLDTNHPNVSSSAAPLPYEPPRVQSIKLSEEAAEALT